MATAKNTTDSKLRDIVSELGDQFFERREHIEAIIISLLAGTNVFLLGPPGTAKSLLVRSVSKRFVGGNYWETLLDRQLPLESIFGPLDLKALRDTGSYHRATDGYAPWAHFLFLDEVGKAGPAVLNPMLTLLNEGIYHNNSVPMDCNIRLAVGASNEELETELAALWDRWMIRMMVNPLQEPGNFATLLQRGAKPTDNPTTVTLDEIDEARNVGVPAVAVPPGIVDNILKLKAQLSAESVDPSDRRWVMAMDILRASAYLNGRSVVDEDDLAILQHVLWDVVEQAPTVAKLVLSFTSEITASAVKFGRMLDELESEIASRKGQSTENRARYGGEAQEKVRQIQTEVNKLVEQANREGRSTAKLDSIIDRTRAVKSRIFVECLNVDPERAAKMSNI